jgi:menaquinone-9 beta-reductase
MNNNKIIIIGGGLAGLTAGIHLLKFGFQVILIEKNEYPKHKVCGEYISNEVQPYLKFLELDLEELCPTKIDRLEFSTTKGKSLHCQLPLGGFGISRYTFDYFLYTKAKDSGCEIIHENVESVNYNDNEFKVVTSNNVILKSDFVIGAYGKRSNLDLNLNRKFIQKRSHWLAIKAHYKGVFDDNLVGLHNFKGGYCGISKVEKSTINVCYLANYDTFKQYKNVEDYQKNVIAINPHLKTFFENATLIFDKPITIGQISFDKKETIQNHILMIGDTAGLIHPLCGNGMAMAIHSAKIVSELIIDYSRNIIKSRKELENKYRKQWNYNFKSRLRYGRAIAFLLQNQKLSEMVINILVIFPFFLTFIIKKTHGKLIVMNKSVI